MSAFDFGLLSKLYAKSDFGVSRPEKAMVAHGSATVTRRKSSESVRRTTIVADGRKETEARLKRVLDGDPGIGILRHADAGYDTAIEQAERFGLSWTVASGLS
jgi:urocanate hydratase